MADLVPVDNDPFASAEGAPQTVPVDHDPFANADTGANIPSWLLATTPKSVEPYVREGLGAVVNDLTSAPGAIYHGIVNGVGRVGHDIVNPPDAVSDVKGLVSGVGNAVMNPGQTADAVLKSSAEHPGYALLNTLAGVGAPTLGQGMLRLGTTGLKAADSAPLVGSKAIMALLGGTSREEQNLAMKAGELGGSAGGLFRANMRAPDYAALQAMGQRGVSQWKAARDAAYEANAKIWGADPTQLQYTPIAKAIIDAKNSLTGVNGYQIDPEAHGVIDQMAKEVLNHQQKMAGVPNGQGARSMDALKQNLGIIMRNQDEGTNAHRVASDIYNAARGQLADNIDNYDEGMVDYNNQRKDINEAVKSLSLGERAGRSTAAGKLISALRTEDSRGIFGARAGSLEAVSRFQPDLRYGLAGAAFNPMMPRGIIARLFAAENLPEMLPKLAEPAAGAAAALALPGALKGAAALGLAIPRLQGNLRYGIGAAQRLVRKVGATQKNLGLLSQGGLYTQPDNQDNE